MFLARLFFLLANLSSQNPKLIDHTRGINYDEFLMNKNNEKKVLSIFFGDDCQNSGEIIDDLQINNFFEVNDISLELIDLKQSENFPDYFMKGW